MRITGFGLFCGLMLSISAFSVDILLPAFLDIATALDVPIQSIQLTVPVYMVGLALAHPVFGILSDRVGRKPAIYVGLGIYALGSLVVLIAGDVSFVLVGRLVQGFGAAAAPVVCRAMIRDRFSGVLLAQNMAIASMFFAIGPMVAPLVGHAINQLLGWRALFVVLLGFSLLMIWATSRQGETLPVENRRGHAVSAIKSDIQAVFDQPQSRFFILLSAVCTAIILSFLTHAPLIYEHDLGASSGFFAVYFAISASGIVIGQIINHRLIGAIGSLRAAMAAAVIIATVAVLIAALGYWGELTALRMTALMFLFNTAYLVVNSNFASLALDPHAQRAGMTAALFGLVSYLVGSALAAGVSFYSAGAMLRWALCFAVMAVFVAGACGYWVRTTRAMPASG